MSEPSPFLELGHLIDQIERHYGEALAGAQQRMAQVEARAAGVEAKVGELESAVTHVTQRSRAIEGKAASLDEIRRRARMAQARLQDARATYRV